MFPDNVQPFSEKYLVLTFYPEQNIYHQNVLKQSMKYIGKIVLDSPSPGSKALTIVVENYWNKINRYLDKAFMPLCDFFQRQKGPAHMLNSYFKSVFV